MRWKPWNSVELGLVISLVPECERAKPLATPVASLKPTCLAGDCGQDAASMKCA